MNFGNELKSWQSILWNTLPKYDLTWQENAFFSLACNANGFLLTSNTGYQDCLFNVYDINSAYPYELSIQKFPLSQDLEIIEGWDVNMDLIKNNYGIVELIFKSMPIPKYKNYDYAIFDGYIEKVDNVGYAIKLTTLDAQIFLDMYEADDLYINRLGIFKDVGYIKGIKHNVNTFYEAVRNFKAKNKEEGKEYKQILNMITYGKLIELDTEKSKEYKTIIRSEKLLLGMWVASYQRFRMFQLFKKYQEDILYMDTDSIMLKANRKFEEETSSTELGKFKVEANNVNIAIIRPKSYVFIKDGKVTKQKIGGLEDDLTIKDLKHLFTFGDVNVEVERYEMNEMNGMFERIVQTVPISLFYPYNFRSLSLD